MNFIVSTGTRRAIAAFFIATPVLIATGPFGTFQAMTLPERALFWGASMGVSLSISAALLRLVIRRLAHRPPYVHDLAMAIGLTACFTPLLYLLKGPFLDGAASPIGIFAMAGVVFAVPVTIGLLRAGFSSVQKPKPAPLAPRLLDRVAEPARGLILAVSGRDHYVDVQTDAGQAELLMRFSDALREIGDLDGMQVHRSHWVADAAVSGIARDGAKVFVQLGCGRRVPVSRTYQDAALSRWSGRGANL
jgi:hypothetical protein